MIQDFLKLRLKKILSNTGDEPSKLDCEPYVIGMALNISTKCQRNCERCFGHLTNYYGKEYMDFETAQLSTNVLLNLLSPSDPCHINIYGGEPLLNWNILQEYIQWFSTLKLHRSSLSTCTNAIGLNPEILDFHFKYKANLTISLDGPFDIHSPKVNRCEFDHIVEMIKYGVKKNINHISVHIVVMKKNILRIKEIISFILSLGVRSINIARDLREFWSIQDRLLLADQIRAITSSNDIVIRPMMESTFDCTSCKSSALMVYPNGDIYDACYNFASVLVSKEILSNSEAETLYLGNINSDISLNSNVTMIKRNINKKLKCYLLEESIIDSEKLIYLNKNCDCYYPIVDFLK